MRIWARLLLLFFVVALVACRQAKADGDSPLALTLAELRAVKGAISVTRAGGVETTPHRRERLSDGDRITIPDGGLAWLRRDGGATWLVSGPASLELRSDVTTLDAGRAFVDCEGADAVRVRTPKGELELSDARVSIDARSGDAVTAYVLRGSARAGASARATMGEQLSLAAPDRVETTALVAWDDWTGGLGTADPSAEAAPYGIGTVGARPPGDHGKPRFSLVIQRLEVTVTVKHDFAITEVDQTFVNPSSDTVEGLFSFRTPERAVLRQFGVDRDGELVWGRVKESAEAVRQYESNVYEGSTEDPALLQWAGAGTYNARLYPIHAGAKRRVVTRYAEWLSREGSEGQRRLYVYPMAAEGAKASLPRIEEFSLTLDLTNAAATSVRSGMGGKLDGKKVVVQAYDFVPRADLAIELIDSGVEGALAYRAPHALSPEEAAEDSASDYASTVSREEADYIAIPLRAPSANSGDAAIDLAIVVDASAATEPAALSIARNMASSLLTHLGPADRAALWAGDASLRPVAEGSGKLRAVDAASRKAWLAGLSAVERGGATDIGALLTEAASQLDPKRRGSVIYIGDGSPSVGELGSDALRQRLSRLPESTRVLVAAVGSQPNLSLLESVARGAPAEQIFDGYGAARASLRLLQAAGRPLWLGSQVDLGPDVQRVLPRELPPISADETLVVVGRLTGKPPKTLRLQGNGVVDEQRLLTIRIDDEGDLRRRWGLERLQELMSEDAGRASLVDVGRRFGLISPVTSWYVPTKREAAAEETPEPSVSRYAEERARNARWRPWGQGGLSLAAGEAMPESASMSYEEYAAADSDNKEGGTGTRAKGEDGSMGKPAAQSNKRYAVRGPRDNEEAEVERAPTPHQQRAEALRESDAFGMIGLGAGGGGRGSGSPSPTAAPPPPPMDEAPKPSMPLEDAEPMRKAEPKAARPASRPPPEAMDKIAEEVVSKDGLDRMWGTIGHGAGPGTGAGFGAGFGRLKGEHAARASKVHMGSISVSGSLPREVVQRIVRQNFGRFRLCHERGLASNPTLEGQVAVRFVIGRQGQVTEASNGGSSLSDPEVVSCVLRAMYGLSFPQPEAGIVTVVYPILFSAPAGGYVSGESAPSASARIAAVGHRATPCGAAADLPLDERRVLWRERLAGLGSADAALGAYRQALRDCEARDWRERSALLILLVDRLDQIGERVRLWRALLAISPTAADAVYRFMLLRVTTSTQLRELHDALGLQRIEPEILERVLSQAKTPAERLALLRGTAEKFPEDTELALVVLHAYEDADDAAGGRAWARKLRRRVDASSHVRTAVGEYYFRLGQSGSGAQAKRDSEEARRTFGEIVEFAPEDPLARRRLGDLLRAHGWFEAALRQYETLQALSPDDPSVPLLLAAAAQGMGKTEEAVRWTEKAGASGSPDGEGAVSVAARALASVFLAQARVASGVAADELTRLRARAARLVAPSQEQGTRVIASWAHPELRPALWTNAAGTMMPAPDNLPLLGVAQGFVPAAEKSRIELRLDPEDAEVAARLGAKVTLTVLVAEGSDAERIATLDVAFADGEGEALPTQAVEFDGRSLKAVKP